MAKNYNIQDAKEGLKAVMDKHGVNMARIIEQMYRLETANFTSRQYVQTGTPGMETGKWGTVRYGYAIGTYASVPMVDNHTGQERRFIVFPSVKDAMLFLAAYINNYGGNFARWNSTDPAIQEQYRNKVMAVTPSIVNETYNVA